MTPAALRAEPVAAAATTDDCLAKPNGDAPAGSHWFYRVERTSGRRCWHLRAQGGQADSADAKVEQGESAVPRRVTAPAPPPSAAAPSEPQASSGDNGPSAAAPAAPPPAPAEWPSASTPSQTAAPIAADTAPITNDSTAEQAPPTRAIDPQIDSRATDANSASAPPAAAPAPSMAEPVVARTATSTIDPNHIPALLGTGLVLLFIILGSIAAHFAGRALQRRREQRAVRAAPGWDASAADAVTTDLRATPGPVVRMRRKDPEPDQPVAPVEAPQVAAVGETAQALEENVRALLYRLRGDLKSNPQPESARVADVAVSSTFESPPMAPAAPSAAAGDLEAALAIWAGNKKRVSP